MADRIHQVKQHKSAIAGAEAISLFSNHAFPRHAHDQFGIGIISAGAQQSWSGIGQVESRAGDVIMVNPGEIHDGMPVSGNARRWHMLYLDPGLIGRELAEDVPGAIEIARPTVSDPVLAELFVPLFAGVADAGPDRLALEEALLRVLMRVARCHGVAAPSRAKRSPAVAKARRRLDEAPAAPTSLAELAALSGVSRFQLLRGFVRELGITPHAYLVQRRVLLARRLLAAGERPVEAALQAGFADQSHLTRAFVRQFGIAPARYRAALG